MRKLLDILITIFVLGAIVTVAGLLIFMSIAWHKNALEHIVGHRVNWWDTVVTK